MILGTASCAAPAARLIVCVNDKKHNDRIVVVNMETWKAAREFVQGAQIVCVADGDWIYYTDLGDGNAWYRGNVTDGTVEKFK